MKVLTYAPVRQKCLFSCLVSFVFLLGRHLPLPTFQGLGLEQSVFTSLSRMTGGDLTRLNLFSLGLSPYLYAGLVLTLFFQKQNSRNWLLKRSFYQKGLTLLFALGQSSFLYFSLLSETRGFSWLLWGQMSLLLLTGSLILLWLAQLNMQYGLGHLSLLILLSLISGGLSNYANLSLFNWELSSYVAFGFIIIWASLAIYTSLVFEKAVYLITVKRLGIWHPYLSTYQLPLVLNPSRNVAVLYASALLLLGQSVVSFLANNRGGGLIWLRINYFFSLDHVYGIGVYFLLITYFTALFSLITFDVSQFSRLLLKSGDYVTMIRPGRETKQYFQSMVWSLTLFSGVIMASLASFPWLLALIIPELEPWASLPSLTLTVTGMLSQLREEIKTSYLPSTYQPIFKEGMKR